MDIEDLATADAPKEPLVGHPAELSLWKVLSEKRRTVQCFCCKRRCKIQNGKFGKCNVRFNSDGVLYSVVYGRPSAVHVDPIEKKPLNHFRPASKILSIGSIGCNFQCSFCQNHSLSFAVSSMKSEMEPKMMAELAGKIIDVGYDLPPSEVVAMAQRKGCKNIAFTYNEPTIFAEYCHDVSALAKSVDKEFRTVMVSNGYETDETIEYLAPVIDAYNIDLKAWDDGFYKRLCGGVTAENVKNTIKKIHSMGTHLEVTTLLIPGENDNEDDIRSIAEFLASLSRDIPFHISAFHPDFKMTDGYRRTPPDLLLSAYEIGKKAGLNFVFVGNIRDEKHASTFCPECNALLIQRNWYDTKVLWKEPGVCHKCKAHIKGIWD